MFTIHTINNNINYLHERCLRTIYNNTTSSIKEMLKRDGFVSIHNRKIQILVTEMFKVYNNASNFVPFFTEILI